MSLREVIFPDRTRILAPGLLVEAELISRVPGWALVRRHDTKDVVWVPETSVALTRAEILRRNNDRALSKHWALQRLHSPTHL